MNGVFTKPRRQYSKAESWAIMITLYTIVILSGYFLIDSLADLIPNKLLRFFIIDLIETCIVFFFSFAFQNSSLYDPYWAVIPLAISWYWFFDSKANSLASQLGLTSLTVFCLRHIFLYARHYTGLSYEDFRYIGYQVKLKDKMWLYWLLSFAGFHLFPTLFPFAGILPLYYAFYSTQNVAYTGLVIAGFVVSIGGVLIETIADEQLYAWRKKKLSLYIDEGLWRYSRHPNYFGEFSFWLGLYFIGLGVDIENWWTGIGALAIWGLLYGVSVGMMEEHMLKKRPVYRMYQPKVSRFMFWWRGIVYKI